MGKRFAFDINKCTGCHSCILACNIENERDGEINWRQVFTFNNFHHPALPLFHISMACNQCNSPSCLKYCPANAFSKDLTTGAVNINPDLCIGCKYCNWTCPFDATKFSNSKNIMEKCDFCNHKLAENLPPVCVNLCPTGALGLENNSNEEKETDIIGFSRTNNQPAIRFVPFRKTSRGPETSFKQPRSYVQDLENISPITTLSKISLKSEWPLVLFTIIAAVLTSWFSAGILSGLFINSLIFIIAGVTGLLLTTFHLGKKLKAYRSLCNFRRSWLSREIVFYSFFLFLGFIYLTFFKDIIFIGWLAIISGFLALLSIDMVYWVVVKTIPLNIHSAQSILSGFYFFSFLYDSIILFGLITFIKICLYVYRKIYFYEKKLQLRVVLSVLRVLSGFALPIAVILFNISFKFILIGTGIIIGEIIDRCEFYMELDIITPQKQMIADFQKSLRKQ